MSRLKKGFIAFLVPVMLISSSFRERNKIEAFVIESEILAWAVTAVVGAVTAGVTVKSVQENSNPLETLKEMMSTANDAVNSLVDPAISKSIELGKDAVKITGDTLKYTADNIRDVGYGSLPNLAINTMPYEFLTLDKVNNRLQKVKTNEFGNVVLGNVDLHNNVYGFDIASSIFDMIAKVYGLDTVATNRLEVKINENKIMLPTFLQLNRWGDNIDKIPLKIHGFDLGKDTTFNFVYRNVKGYEDVLNVEKNKDFQALGIELTGKVVDDISLSLDTVYDDVRALNIPFEVVNSDTLFVPLPFVFLNGVNADTRKTGIKLLSKTLSSNISIYDGFLYNAQEFANTATKDFFDSFEEVMQGVPNAEEIEKAFSHALESNSIIGSLDFVNDLNNQYDPDAPIVLPPINSAIDWSDLNMSNVPSGAFGRDWFGWLVKPIIWIGNLIKEGITAVYDVLVDAIAIPLEFVKDAVLSIPNLLSELLSLVMSLPKAIVDLLLNSLSFLTDLANIITSSIIKAFEWLFVIDEALILKEFNIIKDMLLDKFFIFAQLKNIISNIFYNIDNNPPNFMFTLPDLFGGGTYNLIDVSVIMPFMSLWRGLIAGLVWISFIMSLFRKIRFD